MKIKRTSPRSGKTVVKEINVTPEQLQRWQEGEPIQNVMPHLSSSDREFIISGLTDQDWDDIFPEDDQ